jgi:arginine deiminase
MQVLPQIKRKLPLLSCSSEYEILKKVAICKPSTLDINNIQNRDHFGFKDFVTSSELMQNYENLHSELSNSGIQVYDFSNYIEENDEYLFNQCINRVYTRDVAAILGDSIFLGKAKLTSRIEEFSISQNILQKIFKSSKLWQSTCESSIELGDLLIIKKGSLLINFGLRTNHTVLEFLLVTAWAKGFNEVNVISLPDSLKKIHLDLVCNIVSENIFAGFAFLKEILVTTYLQSGSIITQTLERYLDEKEIKAVWFDNSDLDDFITNYLVANNNLIFANKKYQVTLERKFSPFGIEIIGIDLNGFEKGGGSMRCLTLPLERGNS